MIDKGDGSHKNNEVGFMKEIKDNSNENSPSMDSIIMEADRLNLDDSEK